MGGRPCGCCWWTPAVGCWGGAVGARWGCWSGSWRCAVDMPCSCSTFSSASKAGLHNTQTLSAYAKTHAHAESRPRFAFRVRLKSDLRSESWSDLGSHPGSHAGLGLNSHMFLMLEVHTQATLAALFSHQFGIMSLAQVAVHYRVEIL